jgi:hypothetical protein
VCGLRPTKPAFNEKPSAETCTESVPETTPVPEAVIVSLPTVAVDVTVTLAVVVFCAIVTDGDEKLTSPAPVARLMTLPPAGARSLKVIVSVVEDSAESVNGDGVRIAVRGPVTVTASVPGLRPVPEAVIVSVPVVALVITDTVVLDWVAGIVTLLDEKLTSPLPVPKLTTCPPAGAGPLKLTVIEAVELVDKVSGAGDRVTDNGALTVNATT